nr:hypothetical protein pKpn33002_00180 [Klebsiella pneumoniae]UHA80667.1 hypothetical protein pKpnJMC_00244 [Klebsiella pneumoniae]
MPAPSQTVFDGFQSCRHPIPAGLSYQHEPAVAIFPADVREPEEVERFWFAFSPDGTVFGSEAAELHQTGFLRVNRESELPQWAPFGKRTILYVKMIFCTVMARSKTEPNGLFLTEDNFFEILQVLL